MPTKLTYPFLPKSTKSLRPGQFWAVPLADGRFACGRVVQIGCPTISSPSRAFFGGLHDWIDTQPPTSETIANASMLDWGIMHIRAITRTGGAILGERDLSADGIEPPLQLSCFGGVGAKILRGANSLREARQEEWGKLPCLGCWGWDFIQTIANRRLVQGSGDDSAANPCT